MDKFVIHGGRPLAGTVQIGGAKNATLAMMPAALLASGRHLLHNTPRLRDVTTMTSLLESLGVSVSFSSGDLTLDWTSLSSFEAPYEHVKKMRASVYVLGPLLARHGRAKVSLPGGCAWGPRPINLHLDGMRRLGADIRLEGGYIIAEAKRLRGARILFDVSSVGATGNVLMAATLAKGTTLIENAAMEPEIINLARYLVSMGARIEGIGTGRLEVEGVDDLSAGVIDTIPDRIEAGTFMTAAMIAGNPTRGVRVAGVDPSHLGSLIVKLEDAGATITTGRDWVEVLPAETVKPVSAMTAVYPGFPTDMQAQWMSLMSLASGVSMITDTIYTDRFMHVPELNRLGANITVKENIATIEGVRKLTGAKVMSTDLRASASLILAGLAAAGTTEVLRVYHLDRGYESIERKLQSLGADISRVSGEEF